MASTPTGSTRGTLLVVDDEAYVRDSLANLLRRRDFDVRTAESVAEALQPVSLEGVDLVLSDLKMPGKTGLDLVRELAKQDSSPPVIVLTAYGTVDSAVTCLREGAVDYLLKPANADELVLTVERCLSRAAKERERHYLRDREGLRPRQGAERREPIGVSPAWKKVVDLATTAAASDASLLLVGETGTGKEEVARLVHRRSHRAARPWVAVNCAAIPVELFESELFGHRRGAFTGALADRDGRLRVAHRGTLFLDEINSLALHNQAKLLRVLEDGSFERLGDSRPTQVDVRLLCACNADLEQEVAQGRFRADLYYRINVVILRLPPLRERPEDIEPLAMAFLADAAANLGRRVEGLSGATLELLQAHDWPGNVRELRNVVERAVLLATGDELLPSNLPPLSSASAVSGRIADGDSLVLAEVRAQAERRALLEALRRAEGIRKVAAGLLGIDERNLAYYLRKHGLLERPTARGKEA